MWWEGLAGEMWWEGLAGDVGGAGKPEQAMAYLLVLLASTLCVVALGDGASASDCTFAVPSTTDPSSCVQYDLSTVASQGPYKLSMDTDISGYQLLFNVCGGLNGSSLPKQCSAISAAAAVAYNNASCYNLGSSKNESVYVVSIAIQLLLSVTGLMN